jgi:hypothetical protein
MCQKHPCTKIATFALGKTKSGVPGNHMAAIRGKDTLPELLKIRVPFASVETFSNEQSFKTSL